MTDELFPGRTAHDPARGGACGAPPVPEAVRLLALELSTHVRRLRQEGQPVPREVEEVAAFLLRLARVRQEAPSPAERRGVAHDAPVPERLLVTKGEAAERLGVSVRTVERLVATGRLRQVHVERLARFRVSDLEAYVDRLGEDDAPDPDPGDQPGSGPR